MPLGWWLPKVGRVSADETESLCEARLPSRSPRDDHHHSVLLRYISIVMYTTRYNTYATGTFVFPNADI